MIGRWIKSLFAAKTQEPPEQTIGWHDPRNPIHGMLLWEHGKPIPTVWWECGECHCEVYTVGYSREFTPRYCAYCGIEFKPLSESKLAKANFRDERKGKDT